MRNSMLIYFLRTMKTFETCVKMIVYTVIRRNSDDKVLTQGGLTYLFCKNGIND